MHCSRSYLHYTPAFADSKRGVNPDKEFVDIIKAEIALMGPHVGDRKIIMV